MIEILNGTHETVAFHEMDGVKITMNESPECFPLHWHTAIEIIMPIENEYTVTVNQKVLTFQVGDVFIVAPGTLHILTAPQTGKRLVLLFDFAKITSIKDMNAILHVIHPCLLIRRFEYPALAGHLTSCLHQIIKENQSATAFSEAAIYSQMIDFFVYLGRARLSVNSTFPGIKYSKQHEYTEKFMFVCDYINTHCTEDVTIEELADLAGFSKFHFARLFKQFAGITWYDYLLQKRIIYAERLLLDPELPITQVAMNSGFGSLSTFNRIFKSLKNCTPSEYKLKRI